MAAGVLAAPASAGTGATSSEFLKVGLSARASAMGGAFGAVADDLGALEYNPAGLGLFNNSQFSAMYVSWLAGINFGSVAGAHVLPLLGTVGGSISMLDVGEIEGSEKKFSASSFLVRAGFGRAILDNFIVGASGKIIRESIANLDSTGGTVDGGCLLVPYPGVTLGAALMNAGWTSAFEDKSDALPLLAKFAGAFKTLEGEYGMVILALDLDWYLPPADLFYPAVGVEYWGGKYFALRAGYAYRDTDLNSEAAGLSAGMGVRWEALRIDYAYAPFSVLGNTHRVTFNWEIWPLVSLPLPGSSVGEFRSAGLGRVVLPSPPSCYVEPGARSAIVRWEAPEASDVAGYNVYYMKEGDSSFRKFNMEPVASNALVITDLASGIRHYFQVRAVDSARPPHESPPSPRASTVPF